MSDTDQDNRSSRERWLEKHHTLAHHALDKLGVDDERVIDGVPHQALHCRIKWLAVELERLRGVEAKLPKTADGVRVGPGTSTWGPSHSGEVVEWKWGVMPWYDTEHLQELFNKTYSTREAAEKAKEAADDA